jgi:hypothetical protein
VVAKMLGHSSTEMVRKHYAPWCKRRDDAHIRAVVASRKKTKGAHKLPLAPYLLLESLP